MSKDDGPKSLDGEGIETVSDLMEWLELLLPTQRINVSIELIPEE